MSTCTVISLTNQKGGVAKTTSTVNLGVGLASAGYRVLLVDTDPQSSLTTSLGISHADDLPVSVATILQTALADEAIPDGYGIIHHEEGVDLLPSSIELSGMEIALLSAMHREFVLKDALENYKSSYDYILIDCMPSLGVMTVNALTAADRIIIPTQPSFLSTKGLNLLLRSISKVKRQLNPTLRIDGILMTMVNSRTNDARTIIASIREQVRDNLHVFDTEIPFSVRAAECSRTGKSIFAYDRSGKVAAAYESLTKEVQELEQRQNNRLRTDRVR